MANTEKRIEKLEGMYGPQRKPIPNFVMVDESGKPISEYYAQVRSQVFEARARGEDVELCIFQIPAQELQKGVK